ncbi:hypothetical protein VTN77DRAFT_3660 [Rasamsonia byssochlamydoides]|uniref:uncharacterized protein n=1 Tax=Rasamsonia byssochlamydoides TaxID=89139 RepID=UPI003742F826
MRHQVSSPRCSPTMAQRPQGFLSRTLPKDFTFSSVDASTPKTPEHPFTELAMPPPPRHSSCRLGNPRFRSQVSVFTSIEGEPNIFDLSRADVPLPSIEFPPSSEVSEPEQPPLEPVASDLLQVPSTRRMAFKTPPAQIRTSPFNFPETTPWSSDDAQEIGSSIERPGSACSRASDSSVSSVETYITQPSSLGGGSCTSPESDIHDFHSAESKKFFLESPLRPTTTTRGRSHELPRKKSRWTADMDSHLWNTYQLYLQDPTITPFKTLPGSLPPLGVSHRVAREAKKTWARVKPKGQQPIHSSRSQAIDADRSGAPAKEDGASADNRSGSSTPRAKVEPAKPRWPRSEAATRRRLKYLCRRKFSIAPHYQRLLQSRSPSPFLDIFSLTEREPPRLNSNPATFATRDLGVSLVSNSVPPALSQLSDAVDHAPGQERADDWFNNPVRQPVQQDSNSGSTAAVNRLNTDPVPRLGSPFMYNTWGPDHSRRDARPTTPVSRRRGTIHVTGSRLRSPPRMELSSNVHKRRASHQLELSPNASGIQRNIQDLFREGKLGDGQRRVRLRNRGNTTGGFSSRERIEQLFSAPSPFQVPGSSSHDRAEIQPARHDLLHPGGETIRRLGSPFKLDTGLRIERPPRSPQHAPSLSDPFASSSFSTQIKRDRPNQISPIKEQETPVALPYDPTEEGISDAERIRRQILNLPFTKK